MAFIGHLLLTQSYDGILGLSFGSANAIKPDPSPTFMEAIRLYLGQPLFSVSLREDGSGMLEFWCVDDMTHKSDLISVGADNSRSA